MSTQSPAGRAPPSASFIHRDSTLARMARPLARFLRVEAAGGIVLVVATVVALAWANSPWSAGYQTLWETPVQLTVGSFRFDEDLRHVVNDALMAIFFFVVGLEIKRELVTGELRDRRQVVLPAFAALGGMAVPALIFAAFTAGGDGRDGWGIPMATDIAFALGVMALLGPRVPAALKIFLLTLAIADDLGAIALIAIFYADELQPRYLAVAVGLAVMVFALRRLRVTYPPVYVIGGIALWVVVFESGVHATIAGVVMGVLTPARPLQSGPEAETVVDILEHRELSVEEVRATAVAVKESVSVCDRLIELLHPWTSYLVVPIFALTNAGIALDEDPFADTSVFLGVLLGLVVGKALGITAFAWLATRLRVARLPDDVDWRQLGGAATLAGIGFTVSLFITGLAYDDGPLAGSAKVGILVASAIAAGLGSLLLLTARRPPGATTPNEHTST